MLSSGITMEWYVPDLSDLAETKIRLRAAMLAARMSMPAQVRGVADAALLGTLVDVVRRYRPRTVAAYVPVRGEPGGSGLPAALASTGVPLLLLPVLRPDLDLDWAAYEGPGALAPSGRGLCEPSSPRLGVSAVAGADLVVAPAVAVDAEGVRLGRGGGSYDRALARVPASALVIALLYDSELVARLPAEPHDRRVPAVITPGDGLVYLPTIAGRTVRS